MTDQLAIGVDIGGTKIAFGLVDSAGRVVAAHRLPTLPAEGAEGVLDRVAEGIETLRRQADQPIAGVGIGCPGLLNPETGIIHHATNLNWKEVPLKTGVEARLSGRLPLWIQQDANAGALGEMAFGAARGYSDFAYIAIGTGLGGAAVIGGRLLQGRDFGAMEIGHLPLRPAGRLCACGMRGCPEMYVSGLGLVAGAQEHLPKFPQSRLRHLPELTPPAILDAARAGDELALAVLDEAVDWLTTVLICCAGILNPALFIIAGGLGHAAADLLLPNMRRRLQARATLSLYQRVQIVESQVTSSAVGAASLVWFHLSAQARKEIG